MNSIIFLYPLGWFISFFIGMIFLYFYIQTKKNAKKFKFMIELEIIFWKSKKYFYIQIVLIISIILFFSLIISNPYKKEWKKHLIRKGIDIALVLDLSYSMVAEDIAPNRLEVAKKVLSDFTSKLKTDRVWLIVFSWKPFTSIPLTFDYEFINHYINNISIKDINQDFQHLQGTAIWDALLYGANIFEEDSKREKVIVLFTDGEANKWIDPIQVIRYIKEKNIKVHTVWIGWNKDTFVVVNNMYGSQKIGIWWIDEKNLQAIASMTNGMYYRAESEKTFEKIFEKLDLLPKKEIEMEEIYMNTPFYKPFVYIIFLLLYFFISFHFYYFLRN